MSPIHMHVVCYALSDGPYCFVLGSTDPDWTPSLFNITKHTKSYKPKRHD